MKFHLIVFIAAVLASLGMVGGVYVQGRRLTQLRIEQQRLVGQFSGAEPAPALPASENVEVTPSMEVPNELLQLRNEVSQLNRRNRELEGVGAENLSLKQQLAARGTNRMDLGAGFIRQSEARMAGYETPEATLETFLWAIRTRNQSAVLEALSSDTVKDINARLGGTDDLFKGSEMLFGLRMVRKEVLPDGTIAAVLEVTPDLPPAMVLFRQLNNQWKMSWPPKQ